MRRASEGGRVFIVRHTLDDEKGAENRWGGIGFLPWDRQGEK